MKVHLLSDLLRRGRLHPRPNGSVGDFAVAQSLLPTGFAELDDALHGGWPRAGLSELLCAANGIGELRLLTPALKELCESENRWIVWVNPPHVPYAPALERLGIDLGKVLLVFPKDHREALWAFEQTLATASCSAALGWLSESRLRFADIRRLQLAARKGGASATLFRPASAAHQASPAELRIEARSLPASPAGRLRLDIRKRRGGWPVEGIEVELDAPLTSSGPPARGWMRGCKPSLVPAVEPA